MKKMKETEKELFWIRDVQIDKLGDLLGIKIKDRISKAKDLMVVCEEERVEEMINESLLRCFKPTERTKVLGLIVKNI